MQVLMLRNPSSSLGCELKEGDIGEVSDSLGAELVKIGIAQEVTKKEILGVAKAPKISKEASQTYKQNKSHTNIEKENI